MLLNYLFYIKDAVFGEIWFSDMDDQISIIAAQIDPYFLLSIYRSGCDLFY